MRKWISTFSLLWVVLASTAQEPLTLAGALELGLVNNYEILITEAESEIAMNNNALGTAGFYPMINGGMNSNNTFSNQNNPASFLNGKFSNISGTPFVQLDWMIFEGFRAHITKQQLDLLEEISLGNVAIVVENTLQAIALSYYQAVLNREVVDILEEVLALSADRYDYIMEKKKMGSATTFETLQFKTAFLTDSSNLLQAQLNLENSLRTLNLLMAEDADNAYELVDSIQVFPISWDYEALETDMLSNNNTLQNQYINQQILKKEIRLQQSELYPKLSMSTGYSYDVSRFNPENMEAVRGTSQSFYINFSLSFTLFRGGNILRQIENARIDEQIGQLSSDQLELSLITDLKSFYDSYLTQKEIVELGDLNVETAYLNMMMAEDRLKTGLITSFDYRDIQNAYLAVQRTRLENLFFLKQSELELLRLSGGMISVAESLIQGE